MRAFSINADHLKKPLELGTRNIGGKDFVVCIKDLKLVRLFCGDKPKAPKKDGLTGVTVFETIASLRDDAVRGAIGATKGRNWTAMMKAKALLLEDQYVSVTLPDIAGVSGRSINVIQDKCGSPVWIELNNDTLMYLREVVHAELAVGSKPIRPKSDVVSYGSGITHIQSGRMAGHLRVRRKQYEHDDFCLCRKRGQRTTITCHSGRKRFYNRAYPLGH